MVEAAEHAVLSPSTILKAWISPVTLKEKRSFAASWRPSTDLSTSSDGRNLFTITLRYGDIIFPTFTIVCLYLDIKCERFPLFFLFSSQVRVSQEQEHFLLNPFGLLYSEVTASSLIKVDMQVKPANAVQKRLYALIVAHATLYVWSISRSRTPTIFFFLILGQCGRPRNNELWSQHCRFRPTFGHPRCPPRR